MVAMTAPFGLVSFPLSRLDTLCNDPHAPTAAMGFDPVRWPPVWQQWH